MRADNDEYYELLSEGRAPITFQAGELIFEQGDQGDVMYVLRDGSVMLRDGERLIETVTAPGLFGELALIQDEPRSLTAAAADDAVLVEIPARHFWILVHDTPYFAQLVMTVMARRLRGTGITT
jgi:CRP/FNR family transcriptional regulator, cyclic AMP receptor protein